MTLTETLAANLYRRFWERNSWKKTFIPFEDQVPIIREMWIAIAEDAMELTY